MCDTGSILFPKFGSTVHLFLLCAIFFVSLSELSSSSHITSACFPSLTTTSSAIGTMLYCPNPSCSCHAGKMKRPFASDKSFFHHLQQSPAYKHSCSLSKLLCIPQPCRTTQNKPHIHFSCLKNNGYILTPHFLNNS